VATLTTTIELAPFPVPSEVVVKQAAGVRGCGFSPLPKMRLNQLDYTTLDALCNEFRATVFATAGIEDSPTQPSVPDHGNDVSYRNFDTSALCSMRSFDAHSGSWLEHPDFATRG
jgi:hypothetical protein